VVRIPKMSLMMILCRGDLSGRGASAGQTSIDRTLGAARSNSPPAPTTRITYRKEIITFESERPRSEREGYGATSRLRV
jgi:hypothetical protein